MMIKKKGGYMMQLYLVRHGETCLNREGRYYGHTDAKLSQKGLLQARSLGQSFRQVDFDKVIVSPLSRAVDTARELTRKQLCPDPRLMEQNFGIFEGKTYWELQKEYPVELNSWNTNWQEYQIPEGESFCMVRKRVDDFVKELWKLEGKILLVAHKGTFGHLMASLLSMPLSGYWNFVFMQGCFSRIDLEDGYAIIRYMNAQGEQLLPLDS